MATRKPRQEAESEQAEAQQEEEAIPNYQLEPMTDDLRSRLNVWGNSTLMLLGQIEQEYPGWYAIVNDMFQIVRGTIQVTEQ